MPGTSVFGCSGCALRFINHGQMEGWLRFGGTERYGKSTLMELRTTDAVGMVVSKSIEQVRSTRIE